MDDNERSSISAGADRRPWFGARRFGWGYRPQTWQGYALTAFVVVLVIVIASVTKGHGALALVAVVPVVLIPIVARSQQP